MFGIFCSTQLPRALFKRERERERDEVVSLLINVFSFVNSMLCFSTEKFKLC